MNNRDKRVLVGMSGGIDSSATCIMLQEQGYEVVGVTMRTWDVPSRFSTPGQDEPDDVLEARALAERLVYARKNSQSLCPLQSAIQRANSL